MWLKTLSGNLLHINNASSLSKANIVQVLKMVSPETSTIDNWNLDQLRAIGEKNGIQLLHSTEGEARKEFAAKALKRALNITEPLGEWIILCGILGGSEKIVASFDTEDNAQRAIDALGDHLKATSIEDLL